MTTLTKYGLYIDNANLGKDMLLVAVAPNYEYVNGDRTDNLLGFKYTVVLPQHGFEKLDVKIAGKKLLEVQAGQNVPVSFTNLRVRPYIDYKGRATLKFTADAAGITAKN